MHYLFVGGPGRSGTSFVADRLGTHPSVAALKDVELKIFCEKNGLIDLRHALVETYSPNRAIVALDQFRRLADAIIDGRHGQKALDTIAPAAAWRAALDTFTAGLLLDGHPVRQTSEGYAAAARGLLSGLAGVAIGRCGLAHAPDEAVFLEKTPHNLLAMDFLASIAPRARFLHVMRDPRAIAWSLLAMPWGPDTLPAAARWVESYCGAWADAEAEAASLGLPLLRLHIEDIAAAPEHASVWITGELSLARRPDLFAGVSPEVINRGVARSNAPDRELLDCHLGGWAAHFGYARDRIGRRLTPAFFAPQATTESAPKREPA